MNKLIWPLRILILSPITYWIWQAMDGSLGADPAKELNHQTGLISLIFLVINLWIGGVFWIHTLRRWKLSSAMKLMLSQRRFLGVTNFVFLCLHITLYLILEGFESKAFTQIIEKNYLIFGISAFLGMSILAFTSNDFSVRRLGAKTWKKIHRIVYFIFWLVMGHIFLIEKADLVLFAQITMPLFVFLIVRALFSLLRNFTNKSKGMVAKANQ